MDTTFNSQGAAVFQNNGPGAAGGTDAAGTKRDRAFSIQIDSQGRYVVLGGSDNTNLGNGGELAIWRYLQNGSPDLSFGPNGNGSVLFQHNGPGVSGVRDGDKTDYAVALRIDSRGRYVLSGYSYYTGNNTLMAIWRYNSDGSPDTTFSASGGQVYSPSGPGVAGAVFNASGSGMYDSARALQIDSAGRYVTAGASMNASARTYEMAMWRYLPSGDLDPTFALTGAISFQNNGLGAAGAPNSTKFDFSYALQVDAAGRYVVAGKSKNAAGGTELALWRYLSNGTPDPTFSVTGAVTFQPGGSGAAGASNASKFDVAYAMQIDSLGRYVLFGSSLNSAGGTELAIWRLNSDGTGDPTFSLTGAVTFQSGGLGAAGTANNLKSDIARAGLIDSLGSYLVVGPTVNSAGGTQMAIWRFLSNGQPDR